jgi:putative flippase GtrA
VTPRVTRFIAVGSFGFVVQAAVLAALTAGAGWSVVPATVVAVEAAILVTYVCHERWTWRDRVDDGERVRRLGRFHLSSGLTSLAGNVALTAVGVSVFHLSAVQANLAAVVLLAGINYAAADRWIFSRRAARSGLSLMLLSSSPAHSAAPGTEAIRAWDRHVRQVEAALPRHDDDAPAGSPEGRTLDVPGGAIHQWRGSVLVRNATVNQLVDALLCPAEDSMQKLCSSRVCSSATTIRSGST